MLLVVTLPQVLLAEVANLRSKTSDNGHFIIEYTSKLKPIKINTMHAWILHVKDKNNTPVTDAKITVEGGMPEHNHGLPTQPQVTKNLGNGDYLLEGLRFHMGGWWTVSMNIEHAELNDTVTFDLNL